MSLSCAGWQKFPLCYQANDDLTSQKSPFFQKWRPSTFAKMTSLYMLPTTECVSEWQSQFWGTKPWATTTSRIPLTHLPSQCAVQQSVHILLWKAYNKLAKEFIVEMTTVDNKIHVLEPLRKVNLLGDQFVMLDARCLWEFDDYTGQQQLVFPLKADGIVNAFHAHICHREMPRGFRFSMSDRKKIKKEFGAVFEMPVYTEYERLCMELNDFKGNRLTIIDDLESPEGVPVWLTGNMAWSSVSWSPIFMFFGAIT